jgi:hypothetical protein
MSVFVSSGGVETSDAISPSTPDSLPSLILAEDELQVYIDPPTLPSAVLPPSSPPFTQRATSRSIDADTTLVAGESYIQFSDYTNSIDAATTLVAGELGDDNMESGTDSVVFTANAQPRAASERFVTYTCQHC